MYKKALLFLNGDAPERSVLEDIACKLSERDTYTVCADGAFYYIKDYFNPNIIVADFDSTVKNDIPAAVEILELNTEKDYTDGHIALEYIINKGIKDVVIYGAAGGRPDHILSNYSLLALAAKNKLNASIDTGGFIIKLIEGNFSVQIEPGKIVSLVPYSDLAHILYTRGLKYPIRDKVLDKVHILGISNIAESNSIECEIGRGSVLIFLQK